MDKKNQQTAKKLSQSIVVTGANGWLGTNFVKCLIERKIDYLHIPEDLRIKAVVLPGSETPNFFKSCNAIEVVEADLRSSLDAKRCFIGFEKSTLFHFAGIIHPHRFKQFDEVNVFGTENILEAGSEAKISCAVLMSSNSPFGFNPHRDHRFDESSPYSPYMGYGSSKMKMELIGKRYSDVFPTRIIRAPWFYGPHQPPRQTEFFTMIKNGKFPIIGSGKNLRSMTYVDNLVQGLLLASNLSTELPFSTFWISDENPYSTVEIVKTIETVLEDEFGFEVKENRIHLPNIVSTIGEMIDGSLQTIGYYHKKFHVLSELNKDIACSIEKAKLELGYSPNVSLYEGMKNSISWCLENGHQI